MQPRVTAILVARNGGRYLPRTLAALAAQLRRPDETLYVDSSSSDNSAELLIEHAPHQLITTPGKRTFGGAVAHALQLANPAQSDNEWLWLLGHDNAPEPGALAALLGAVEVAPSVAVAGPKLMSWEHPSVIESFGETLTKYGRSLTVVSGELDQAQHDIQSDQLGVAAGGMLVRRSVWEALGGFDPGLPSADAALDFSVRARLAGHRVVGVPSARVATAGPPELFGRKSLSAGAQNRVRRAAQLHRRMVYAPPLAVPLHWLTLVPLAILRSLGHLIGKRPGAVGGELAAGIGAAFDGTVGSARKHIRRTRRLGWAAVGALRMPWAEVRELRAQERAAASPSGGVERERPGFFGGGGAWVVLLAAIIGIVAWGRVVDSPALSGGGLLPLSSTLGEVWSHIGYGWRYIGAGFMGAADPFTYVLAVLSSVTFWSPSYSIVLLWVVAIPLSALAAWWAAARFSTRAWAPAIAALAWALAPPLLASLAGGHIGAVIAHVLLPTLLLAVVNGARSWSMAALAALLFAAVTAASPVLAPVLLALLLAWMAANPTRVHRLLWIPIPAAALFAPLVVQQLSRGNWLALLADPGRPFLVTPASGFSLALGSPEPGLSGWEPFLESLGVAPGLAPLVTAILLAPLAGLALLALFVPGSRRSIPAMVIALLGFGTAVFSTHVFVTVVGSQVTPIWAGSGLSLYWLGLCGALMVALESLGKRASLPAFAAGVGVALVAVPLFIASATGATDVVENNGRLLPAFTSAEAAARPDLGTLELTAQSDGGVAVTVHRGLGTTLDEQSTLDATDTRADDMDDRLAVLAGNIASRSGFDIAAELDELQIAFVLLPDADSDAAEAVRQRVAEALDGNRILSPIGETANGYLWYYSAIGDGEAPGGPSIVGTNLGVGILIAQGLVFGVVLLLAIPTTRRRRVRSAKVAGDENALTEGNDDE